MSSSGVRNDVLALSHQVRLTIPLVSSLSPVQQQGSMIWDNRLQALFVSNGTLWQYLPPGSLSIQDLFSVLTVGNFTGGLDIDTTGGSEIISSDGNIILSGLTSTGTGNISSIQKLEVV
jgi:hypothetical protein